MAVKINELIIRTKIENKDAGALASSQVQSAGEPISLKRPVAIVSVNKINRER